MISERVGTPKGASGRSGDDFARAVSDLRSEKAALDAEAVALVAAAASGKKYGEAIEYARKRAELLAAAQRSGKAITPELTGKIDQLAQGYAEAGNKADEAAQKMKKMEERGQKGADALSDMFLSVLDGSKTADEALAGLLRVRTHSQ